MTKMAVEMLVYVIRKPAAMGASNKHVRSMALIPAMAVAEFHCLACEIANKTCLYMGYMSETQAQVYSGSTVNPAWLVECVDGEHMHVLMHSCVLQQAHESSFTGLV